MNAWFQLLPERLQKKRFVLVGARALNTPTFRKALLADADAALKTIGVTLPPRTRVHFLDSTAREVHIVLPPPGGIAPGKVVIRDEDLKAEFPASAEARFGDADTVAGDFARDPTKMDGSVADGEFYSDSGSTRDVNIEGDGNDPTPRDNFWSDA